MNRRRKSKLTGTSESKNEPPIKFKSSATISTTAEERQSLFSKSTLNRVIRRVILSASIMLVVYGYNLYNKSNQNVIMASHRDDIGGSPVGQLVACSGDFSVEQKMFKTCSPQRCGRFVSDSILSQAEVLEMRIMAETIFSLSRPSGGVAIFDFFTGALSNGTQFVNFFKFIEGKKHQLIEQKSWNVFQGIRRKILAQVAFQFGINPRFLYITSPTFFSRMTTKPAKTLNDQYWHSHVDKENHRNMVYTSLLYLSTYKEEFEGGRFIFLNPKQNITIEPKFGRVTMFTSGSENEHQVEKVSSGIRFALTIAFTCDPTKAAPEKWP